MSDANDGNLPQWLSVMLGAVIGLFTGTGILVKLVFSFNSRLQLLEAKDVGAIVRKELEHERHNVLYPMLQTRVYAALDKIEEEVKVQGQNVAILLERDRSAEALSRFADTIAKSIGESVANALNHRQP